MASWKVSYQQNELGDKVYYDGGTYTKRLVGQESAANLPSMIGSYLVCFFATFTAIKPDRGQRWG